MGRSATTALNRSLVSLTLDEFASIPHQIGIASGPSKAGADPQRSCAATISTRWSPTRPPALQMLELAEQEAA